MEEKDTIELLQDSLESVYAISLKYKETDYEFTILECIYEDLCEILAKKMPQ